MTHYKMERLSVIQSFVINKSINTIVTFFKPMTKTTPYNGEVGDDAVPYIEVDCTGLLLKIKAEAVAAYLIEKSKQEKRRKQRQSAISKFRINNKCKIQCLIDKAWELFPKNGLDRVKADCLCDVNINYGGHQLSLGFDLVSEEAFDNQVVGTRSLGMRYENEHTVVLRNRERCLFSEKNFQFLQCIHTSIYHQFPEMRQSTKDFMRVNLVAGAKTSPHTDTMRGATPNFFMVEEPSDDGTTPFCLQVRLFPNFKTSVVLLDGQLHIPHKQKRSHLIMIGLKNNNPHYYVFPTKTIDSLQPVGDIRGLIVVGVKEEKIQVMSDEYQVYSTTKSMPLMPIDEVFELAKRNPTVLPRKLFAHYDKPGVWHKFWGWKNSHCLLPGTDYRMRRIHTFYRPVREETPAARLRTRKSNDTPINCTFVGCGPDKH